MDQPPPAPELRQGLPPFLSEFLNGEDLPAKTQALRLATVSLEGWPHAALLTAGDMLALSPFELRFCLYPQTTTAMNLARDGRCTLSWVQDGGLGELRLHSQPLRQVPAEMKLAFFSAKPLAYREHRAPYAELCEGLRFRLHDAVAELARWQRQLEALRAAW